jgi:hypothetical protein
MMSELLFINQKPDAMKNVFLLIILTGSLLIFSCSKKESEKFRFLTDPVWVTDSLLANGVNAAGAGGLLNKFVGDAKFNTDGSGYFGKYTGTWKFNVTETEIVINTDSIPIPITADIKELTSVSLKLTTTLPNPSDLFNPYNIRMTFKAK